MNKKKYFDPPLLDMELHPPSLDSKYRANSMAESLRESEFGNDLNNINKTPDLPKKSKRDRKHRHKKDIGGAVKP